MVYINFNPIQIHISSTVHDYEVQVASEYIYMICSYIACDCILDYRVYVGGGER